MTDRDESGRAIVRDPQGQIETFMAAIPGLSKQVPAKQGTFGEDVTRDLPLSPLLALIAPTSSAMRSDEVIRMLKESGASVGKPSGRKQIEGNQLDLTDKEERMLIRLRGQLNRSRLETLRKSPVFRALPRDAQKAKITAELEKLERARNPYELKLLQQLIEERK
jgi:hypothetical protein